MSDQVGVCFYISNIRFFFSFPATRKRILITSQRLTTLSAHGTNPSQPSVALAFVLPVFPVAAPFNPLAAYCASFAVPINQSPIYSRWPLSVSAADQVQWKAATVLGARSHHWG